MEYSGTGDPKRSLELLWGVQERPRRGPKPKLTVDRIITTAIELADAADLEALSMRRIAEELGVATMSIYTYVPSKAELIDVMMDRALGELAPPDDVPGGWRPKLAHIARQNWDLYHRHPWLLQISTSRPPMGPNLIGKYEYELRAVDGLGLTDVEMDSVISLVTGHAQSSARVSVNAAQAERRTGMTDEEWWEATGPVLGEVLEPDAYPLGSRVGTAASQAYGGAIGPEHAFEFGLERILDGIAALITARTATQAPSN
ncbi:TetR/AcrR family transcriptional regulator [Actinomadura rudentiformis]|uniref:TetR/AcrR family transcriptional regulator n=1 Tax=Actinomadura rudentiformis TaxID=359158 RepID=A0A6H9YT43_9ACTN|nr:TetR/AcrR family transcriptional regulator [Actinomadura rudentiformis]KAB2344352.1 TetR/AcrR family transcriptional regulator [Actinomadura rudentiformis]